MLFGTGLYLWGSGLQKNKISAVFLIIERITLILRTHFEILEYSINQINNLLR